MLFVADEVCTQLDSEVALLIKERDLKLNWLSSKNEGERGCYRANKRRRGTNDVSSLTVWCCVIYSNHCDVQNKMVSANEGLPEEVPRPACTQDVMPAAYSMIT